MKFEDVPISKVIPEKFFLFYRNLRKVLFSFVNLTEDIYLVIPRHINIFLTVIWQKNGYLVGIWRKNVYLVRIWQIIGCFEGIYQQFLAEDASSG